MERNIPYVLSLAGLDPSAGAGLLADIKTFESLGVYGLGVCTALTVQTDIRFLSVQWLAASQILEQARPLLERFPVSFCKIGIMSDVQTLLEVITGLKALQPNLHIVLDPVLRASAGYTFHTAPALNAWQQVLQQLYLLTPNYDEALLLSGRQDGQEAIQALLPHCTILLKGGHRLDKKGWDSLHTRTATIHIPPGQTTVFPKHGSGCVLSAAITARLALGDTLTEACMNGKYYTERFLNSHSSLLGYHYA